MNLIGWTFVGTLCLINAMLSHHSATRALVRSGLKKIQYSMINNLLNLSIVTMVFAAIVNFKHCDLSTNVGIASLAASSASCLYIIGWFGVCIKNTLSNNKNFSDMTVEQQKDLSKAAKLYESIAMLRKILLSVAIATLFGNTTVQLGVAVGLNVAFLIYAIICNPYGTFYKLFDVLAELGNASIAGGVLWLSLEPKSMKVGEIVCQAIIATASVYTAASLVEQWRGPVRQIWNWIKSFRAQQPTVSLEIHPE